MTDAAFTPDPGLSWSQLRAFQACRRLRSFNSAAAVLGLTPAAVRHQVALLEGRLGGPLFVREGGRLAVTPLGEGFGREIDQPFQALIAACANAAAAARDTPLLLTAPPLFARRFLLGRGFLQWCHDNHVQLDVTDARRDLGQAVAAVRLGEREGEAVRIALALAASPAVAAEARPREIDWWRGQTLVSPALGLQAWPILWAALGLQEVVTAQSLQFTSYAAALDAARDGAGLVLAPLPLADPDLASGRLALLDAATVQPRLDYGLLMSPKLAATPRARALRRRIQVALRD